MTKASAKTPEGAEVPCVLNMLPDQCAACQTYVRPVYVYASVARGDGSLPVNAVFRCPVMTCGRLFIAEYSFTSRSQGESRVVALVTTAIARVVERRVFPSHIEQVSPEFCEIYNQALTAEANGL